MSSLYRYSLFSLIVCLLYFGFKYIGIFFEFPQKLFDCGNFGRPNEICEMVDTAFGLSSFKATTHYTCLLYCHSTLYNKLSCISAKITGFMSRLVVCLGFVYVSDNAAVFHNQGESTSLKKLS